MSSYFLNMLEKKFQSQLKKDIEKRLPGSIVVKLEPTYIQGIPDLLILYKDHWAALECKRNSKANLRPNQEYYINKLNEMSFARFIFPENKEEVLNEIQQSFGA